jgi:tetratricopeptide (TPR) repeat protein
MVTTIVTFNLALAYHLRALSCNIDQSARGSYLQMASIMYEQSYNLQWEIGDEVTFVTNIFSMAALNNLGQVYRRLGDNEKAKLCFSHLLSTLLLVRRDHCDNTKSSLAYILRAIFRTTSHLMTSKNETNKTAAPAA